MPQVAYVAYIDESGDDGLGKVRPVDPNGASEWFVLSAIVIRAETKREVAWVHEALERAGAKQRKILHFQDLEPYQRTLACSSIAEKPLRFFVAMSNKVNMRAYSNPLPAKVSAGKTWFYWWMTRLLLERVTDFCERQSLQDYGEPRLVRLEFSRRKGLRYSHFQTYLYWLRMQSKANALFLNRGDLKWSVVDPMREVYAWDHSQRAGLQMADAVASAFYQSVAGEPAPNTLHARALEPRMARDENEKVFGYGFKLMPGWYHLRAPKHQRDILEFYRNLKK
jgi:hypothetical protein